jgi:hypothetical protein
MQLSPQKRLDIIDALARGTVPQAGLDALAVGMERLRPGFDYDLQRVAVGRAAFKAVRGEYGSGKTFALRWLIERARVSGFAVTEVQISESETPLHRLETIYRRAVEHLSTDGSPKAALRDIIGAWFFQLESDVLATGSVDENDEAALQTAVQQQMEKRLHHVAAVSPLFAAALRGYHKALHVGDHATAEGLLAFVAGQPHVAASIRRSAGLKGEIDNDGAANALRGLLHVMRDAGFQGMVLVLDEVETLQRIRTDYRDKGLNSLRQLIDELDAGRFPGLYLVVSGTPAFFDGPMGAQRLPPLAQRLATDFGATTEFDNPLAIQVRLSGFEVNGLVEVGIRVRDIFANGTTEPERVLQRCDNAYLEELAQAVTQGFGGKARVAPRVFLKKLVADILQRIELFPTFDPRQHYALTIQKNELNATERKAMHPDDLELELEEHVE